MGKATVRAGVNTWTNSAKPKTEYFSDRFLRLHNSGPAQRAFVFVSSPVPRGAIVLSATLRFRVKGSSSGSKTLTLHRLAEKRAMRRVNHDNQPGVTGTGITSSVPAVTDGDIVEFNVTSVVQAWANGTPNHGLRIVSNSSSLLKLCGFDSERPPNLAVTWSDAPKKPTDLRPSSGIVAVSKPTLQFAYTDVSGRTDLAAVQVQIDPNANVATSWDSGGVATTTPQLDLSETSYPGLASGATTQWRVRVKDGAGLWSVWSDWAEFSMLAKGTVAITSPPAPPSNYVNDATPPITWSFSLAQTAWQVIVWKTSEPKKILHDTGKVRGTDSYYGLPRGVLKDAQSYTVAVRAWDAAEREATPGNPIFSSARRDFSYQHDGTVAAPTGLSSSADPDAPRVVLSWTRSTSPDSWEVWRDGKVIEALLAPDQTVVSGTSHSWADIGAPPMTAHSYEVRAIVNGKASPAATTTAPPCFVGGVYLMSEDGPYVPVAGDDGGSWDMGEDAEVFNVLGSSAAVRVVTALRGYEGSISGVLVDGFGGLTLAQAEAALWEIKGNPTAELRLSAGDVNVPVVVGEVTVAPTPVTRRGQVVKDVSFSFWQTGETPYALGE